MSKINNYINQLLINIPIGFILFINKINDITNKFISHLPERARYVLILYRKAIGRGMMFYTSLYLQTWYLNEFLKSLIAKEPNNISLILFVQGYLIILINVWIIASIVAPIREWLFIISANNKK